MKLKDKKLLFPSYNYLLLIASCLLIGITACDKFVEVGLPQDQITVESAFASNSGAEASTRGIYAYAVSGGGITGLCLNLGYSADELIRGSYSADQQDLLDNKVAPGNSTLYTMWKSFYNTIYQCNNVLKYLPISPAVTADKRDQLEGEAKFMRAFTYFYLVNLWDSVPLALTPDYDAIRLLPRSSSAAVYAQITEDLTDAQNKLSSTLNTTAGTRTRANKWAATALLARVKLYQQKWTEAEAQATAVIGAGFYMLPPLSEVFLTTSRESILQLTNAGSNIYTGLGIAGANITTNPAVRLSSYAANLLVTGDQRKVQWVTPTLNGVYKFKTYSNTQTGALAEAVVALRLAEIYLIRAEARAQQDNITGPNSAATDLNMIRTRAGLPGTTATTKAAMLQAISDERMIELFAEFGHRWLDIKRTGQADAVFGAHKTGWVHTAALYPIPYTDILYDTNLTQNPGY